MNESNSMQVVTRAATLTQFAISVLFSNPVQHQFACSLEQLLNRYTPSEYVQSVEGHGRQHDIFPTSVGVGRQRRPWMTRHVSIFCHPRACDARRGTR